MFDGREMSWSCGCKMPCVDRVRWRLAQQAEALYWQATQSDPSEFSRILHERIDALDLACRAVLLHMGP